MQAGITENYFQSTFGGGIPFKNNANIFFKAREKIHYILPFNGGNGISGDTLFSAGKAEPFFSFCFYAHGVNFNLQNFRKSTSNFFNVRRKFGLLCNNY